MKQSFFLSVLLSCLLLTVPFTSQGAGIQEFPEDLAIIHKTFELYPGKKDDPYTLFYPIEVKRPGLINILVKTHLIKARSRSDRLKSTPVKAILVDIRAFNISTPQWQQWINKVNQYNPAEWIAGPQLRKFVDGVLDLLGKKKKSPVYLHGETKSGKNKIGIIRHAVDAPELQKTGGRYVLILRNTKELTADGNLAIRYPGDHWEYDPETGKFAKKKPDLTITKVSLNKQNQLQIRIRNKGEAPVSISQYHQPGPEMVTLLARIDGRNYGVTLTAFDPAQELRKPGRSVTYTFKRVILNKPTKVTVTIDANHNLYESNENNNTVTTELGSTKKAVLEPVTIP